MSIQNLAIVFGPTLFGQGFTSDGQQLVVDPTLQNKVCHINTVTYRVHSNAPHAQAVETILEHYMDIFIEDQESA